MDVIADFSFIIKIASDGKTVVTLFIPTKDGLRGGNHKIEDIFHNPSQENRFKLNSELKKIKLNDNVRISHDVYNFWIMYFSKIVNTPQNVIFQEMSKQETYDFLIKKGFIYYTEACKVLNLKNNDSWDEKIDIVCQNKQKLKNKIENL